MGGLGYRPLFLCPDYLRLRRLGQPRLRIEVRIFVMIQTTPALDGKLVVLVDRLVDLEFILEREGKKRPL